MIQRVRRDDPCDLPARVLAQRIRRRQLSALEHADILPGFQAPAE